MSYNVHPRSRRASYLVAGEHGRPCVLRADRDEQRQHDRGARVRRRRDRIVYRHDVLALLLDVAVRAFRRLVAPGVPGGNETAASRRTLGVKQVSRETPVRSLALVVELVSACSQPGGNGSGGSSATYSGSDLAASLKQGAVQQGYAADKVTAICGTAPKRAGAVSDCTITRNGIADDIRVTYSDDQGHFTTETLR